MTVTLKLYSFSTNTLKWSHAATIDNATAGLAHYDTVAGDLDTAGDYYTIVEVTKTGYARTYVAENYKVITNQQSRVTPAELRKYLDIPTENAKPDSTIQYYVDQAQSLLHLEVPALTTTVNQQYLDLAQKLIMIKAAIFYFMNSAENNINPEIRLQKIKAWTEEYNNAVDSLQNVLATTLATGAGVMRRTANKTAMPSPLESTYSPYSEASNTAND